MGDGPVTAKDCVSEFIGTFLLVLTVGCNTVATANGVFAALSIATVLTVSIYALGTVSGAHFNPAVTTSAFLAGACSAGRLGTYVAVQLVAGVLAGVASAWLHGDAANLQPGVEPGSGEPFGFMAVLAAETAYTFLLCFVVLRTAVSKANEGNEFFGLAIGFVIVAGGYAAGWISGGAFNPAVAVGVDVGSSRDGIFWCLPYTCFELVGASLAAVAHKFLELEGKAEPSRSQVIASEFIGTYFLVLTVALNVAGASPAIALSIGASLMCGVYALGSVSGAHFNPAVTLALTLTNNAPASLAPTYMCAQLVGGLAGAFTSLGMTGRSVPLAHGTGYGWGGVAVAEVVYTFVLCFVVLNVATPRGGQLSHMHGLAVGFCIVAGGFAIGSVSGGSLNPAVSVALDTSHALTGGKWINCLGYVVLEFVGAGLAAAAYSVCRPEQKKA